MTRFYFYFFSCPYPPLPPTDSSASCHVFSLVWFGFLKNVTFYNFFWGVACIQVLMFYTRVLERTLFKKKKNKCAFCFTLSPWRWPSGVRGQTSWTVTSKGEADHGQPGPSLCEPQKLIKKVKIYWTKYKWKGSFFSCG